MNRWSVASARAAAWPARRPCAPRRPAPARWPCGASSASAARLLARNRKIRGDVTPRRSRAAAPPPTPCSSPTGTASRRPARPAPARGRAPEPGGERHDSAAEPGDRHVLRRQAAQRRHLRHRRGGVLLPDRATRTLIDLPRGAARRVDGAPERLRFLSPCRATGDRRRSREVAPRLRVACLLQRPARRVHPSSEVGEPRRVGRGGRRPHRRRRHGDPVVDGVGVTGCSAWRVVVGGGCTGPAGSWAAAGSPSWCSRRGGLGWLRGRAVEGDLRFSSAAVASVYSFSSSSVISGVERRARGSAWPPRVSLAAITPSTGPARTA